MIQCFLLPELMIQLKEAPNALRETPDGKDRPNEMDPVFELFIPSHPEKQGAQYNSLSCDQSMLAMRLYTCICEALFISFADHHHFRVCSTLVSSSIFVR